MNKVHEYFLGERNESLIFIIVGAAAAVCSFYFWLVINSRFYNGIGWPLLFIALIQLVVGTIIYFRSPNDEKRVAGFITNSQKNIRNIEIPRMEKVMRSFTVYRYVEMSLMVIGLIVFLMVAPDGFWRGVSLGLIIQAGLMLLADSFAENRGRRYLDFLKESFG